MSSPPESFDESVSDPESGPATPEYIFNTFDGAGDEEPSEELSEIEPEPEDDTDKDFVPVENEEAGPVRKKRKQNTPGKKNLQTPEPVPITQAPKYIGYQADQERAFRRAKHHETFVQFMDGMNRRHRKRTDLETRNKIWDDGVAKAKKRIEDIEEEKRKLEKKIEGMGDAKETYGEGNRVEGTREEDLSMKEKWEKFFALEIELEDLSK